MTENRSSGEHRFQTTQWSVVLNARRDSEAVSDEWRNSLESLCEDYWYPLYAYLRRKGYAAADAQDLTQDFFASLIEKDFLRSVDPEIGRFRWFLMDAIKKYAANWNAAQSAEKRGGGRKVLSLSFDQGESQYTREPVDGWTPEKLFDRRWALSLLDRALDELRSEYESGGKHRYFQVLKVYLTADNAPPSYSDAASKLGLTQTAIKVAIHRLRDKYRQTIRRLVAETLDQDQRLDDEIDELMEAL